MPVDLYNLRISSSLCDTSISRIRSVGVRSPIMACKPRSADQSRSTHNSSSPRITARLKELRHSFPSTAIPEYILDRTYILHFISLLLERCLEFTVLHRRMSTTQPTQSSKPSSAILSMRTFIILYQIKGIRRGGRKK